MVRLKQRLEALEKGSSVERMYCIEASDDQTEESAIAAYESQNGPIGPDDGSRLIVFIRKPKAA